MIETRTETVTLCPAELLATRPSRPVPPSDAALSGSPAGLDWLNRVLAWAGLIEDRLADAAAQCPVSGSDRRGVR